MHQWDAAVDHELEHGEYLAEHQYNVVHRHINRGENADSGPRADLVGEAMYKCKAVCQLERGSVCQGKVCALVVGGLWLEKENGECPSLVRGVRCPKDNLLHCFTLPRYHLFYTSVSYVVKSRVPRQSLYYHVGSDQST